MERAVRLREWLAKSLPAPIGPLLLFLRLARVFGLFFAFFVADVVFGKVSLGGVLHLASVSVQVVEDLEGRQHLEEPLAIVWQFGERRVAEVELDELRNARETADLFEAPDAVATQRQGLDALSQSGVTLMSPKTTRSSAGNWLSMSSMRWMLTSVGKPFRLVMLQAFIVRQTSCLKLRMSCTNSSVKVPIFKPSSMISYSLQPTSVLISSSATFKVLMTSWSI